MQARHNFGPENGPHHTEITDLTPRTARNPQIQGGDPPSDLAGGLRWWSRYHNWYELGYIRNRLKLERAFAAPIRQTANQFMADRRGTLARQVKEDFADLLDLTEEFDRICRLGCSYENEYKVCQDIRGRLEKMLSDLADLVKSGDQPRKPQTKTKPPKEASKTEWITYQKAAELLLVDRSTICRWAQRDILESNGKKGKRRRVSKGSVLIKERQDAVE